jgi:hypothetical protein
VRQDPEEQLQIQQHMNVIDVQCTSSGLDHTGAVKAGFLRISCPAIWATINLRSNPKGEPLYRLSLPDKSISLRFDQYESPWCFQPDVPLVVTENFKAEGRTERAVCRSDAEHPEDGMVDNVVVRIAFITTHLIPKENRYNRYCMALGPSKTVRGAYERVGFWGYYNETWKRLLGLCSGRRILDCLIK